MSRKFKSENKLDIYEIDGEDKHTISSKMPKLTVSEHWNRKSFVVLRIEEGKKITVSAAELKRAIDNAQNAHNF